MMNRIEHLLWILSEECDEVGQRTSKAARFGLDEVEPEQELTNEARIMYELNDVVAVVEMLQAEGALKTSLDREKVEAKKLKVEKYLLHSKKCGTLEESETARDEPVV
jgi:hypothetical protein